MFNISFTINGTLDYISGFDLGYIKISLNDTIISSSSRLPDQSIMVFPTIVDMLDGLRKLWKNKEVKEYRLVCADSSFTILFVKKRSGLVNIEVGESVVLELDEKLLAKQVYDSCSSFFRECRTKMAENDPIIEDVETALQEYKESLWEIKHYYHSNDHKPAHVHVTDSKGNVVRVGQNGKPLKGEPKLNREQKKIERLLNK